MNSPISPALKARPSRSARMISCGRTWRSRPVGANEAAQQALEIGGGAGRHFLRLRVARIAAGKARGIVGNDRDRGAAQARAARQDHFRHSRHADEVGAEVRAARISAGVSKLGPENHMYTPSWRSIFSALAAAWSSARSASS